MYEKLNNGDDLFDHEVLEILLYSACPRVNTNPLAHALLERFGSIAEIFGADIEELKAVQGVGESVAKYLKTVGLCVERTGRIGNCPTLKTWGDCRRFIHLRLNAKSEEFIELYFVNKSYRVIRIYSSTSNEKSRASARFDEIARNISIARPHGIIIAHNHVDGSASPSEYDDDFTKTVQFICNMNSVKLIDHIIYLSRDELFSYKNSGRLDKIKSACNWENFQKWIKTSN